MASMSQLIAEHTDLSHDDHQWLQGLVREWHLLADTSFSDLVLWVPDQDPNIFWAAEQVRPNTGPTALEDDVVGDDISYDPESLVTAAWLSREICETSGNKLNAGIPVDVWAIPIIRHDEVIAVVERHTNQMGVRAPGALEDAYLEIANILSEMLWMGQYPLDPRSDPSISPRVGDGFVRIDPDGFISYASPNGVTASRLLGVTDDLVGERAEAQIKNIEFIHRPVETTGSMHFETVSEFNIETRDAAVRVRAIPLKTPVVDEDQVLIEWVDRGTLMLTRDITEIRDRDRELVTKDATIREIHHRVKNNLQTVAALLRLQSRRVGSDEARDALSDAMRRVQSIASVHEILSQSFDEVVPFDEVADRILLMVGDVAAADGSVHARRSGTFGTVPGDVATALSLVMTELCQNGIEHGLASSSGEVVVHPTNQDGVLTLEVIDNGEGLPDDFVMGSGRSLGLSIVTTLVSDLGGSFTLTNNDQASPFPTGATARVIIPLDKPETADV